MTHKTLHKLHTLKGKLKARTDILGNDIAGLMGLTEDMVSDFYKGHTQGRIETMKRWHRDAARLLADVEQIIEEAENV